MQGGARIGLLLASNSAPKLQGTGSCTGPSGPVSTLNGLPDAAGRSFFGRVAEFLTLRVATPCIQRAICFPAAGSIDPARRVEVSGRDARTRIVAIGREV